MTSYPKNFCLFACHDDDRGFDDALEYVKTHGYTQENVRIKRRDNMIVVVVR
jgi:hypothetical protein